jgi:methylmalonyl-CoA mutase N-terminal domain/subunit
MGGTQSLHTNALDETLALPSEFAATIALRTQQILADEIGVTNTIDPLAGSYFVESLTKLMEEKAREYINKIDDMGGMLAAIDKGFPQMEIADAAYHYQQQIDKKEKVVVGVNKYVVEEKAPPEILRIDEAVEERQIARLRKVKKERDNRRVAQILKDLRAASRTDKNLMPYVIEAVREYATEQEICDVWRDGFGEYRDPGFY